MVAANIRGRAVGDLLPILEQNRILIQTAGDYLVRQVALEYLAQERPGRWIQRIAGNCDLDPAG